MRPQFLKEGETVAVMAIASAPSDAQLAANWKQQLESWGLKVKIGKNIEAKFPGDFAGTHQQRADDLQNTFEHESSSLRTRKLRMWNIFVIAYTALFSASMFLLEELRGSSNTFRTGPSLRSG